MKILIGTFTFHPEGNGVAEVASIHAFGLAARGHDVTVACPPVADRKPSDYPLNLKVVEFDVSKKAGRGAAFTGQVEAYQKFVASLDCDVMIFHCWNGWPLDLAFPLADHIAAKKVIFSHGYTAHIWDPVPKFAWGLGAWIRLQPYFWSFPRQIAKVDHLIVLSDRKDISRFMDRTLMGLLRNPRWSAIPNGASIRSAPADLPDFRARYGIEPGKLLVLDVANYCDRKNQLYALRAFARAAVPNSVLVFIGSEENDYALKMQQSLEAMEGTGGEVLILHHVPKEMIFAAYHAADLFVLSSKAETQPVAILDAMACGIPFISTDTGCVAELAGGVVVSSETEMAESIRELALNPNLRDKLGQQGVAAVDTTYNWSTILDRLENLLETLVAGKPQSP